MALCGIGDTEQGITFSTMALRDCDPWMVHPLRCASPHLADLDDRITGFFTRTTRRQPDDHAL